MAAPLDSCGPTGGDLLLVSVLCQQVRASAGHLLYSKRLEEREGYMMDSKISCNLFQISSFMKFMKFMKFVEGYRNL